MNEIMHEVEVVCDWLLRVEHLVIICNASIEVLYFSHMKNSKCVCACVCACVYTYPCSTCTFAEKFTLCNFLVCRGVYSASSYSYTEEPITIDITGINMLLKFHSIMALASALPRSRLNEFQFISTPLELVRLCCSICGDPS